MSVNVTVEVDKCMDCQFVTNSAREHDCAFTPTPATNNWWCTHTDFNAYKRFVDPEKVSTYCPFIKAKKEP